MANRSNATIKRLSIEAQVKHFLAKLKAAKEFSPDGFTLDIYGKSVDRKTGFAVGVESITELQAAETIRRAFYQNYSANVVFIGGWKNPENGEFELDTVFIYEDVTHALQAASVFNQKAVWSFACNGEIYLNPNYDG